MIRVCRCGRDGYGVRARSVLSLLAGLGVAALCLMAPASSAPALDKELTIVAFGDSLTAGYLLPQDQGFAPKLEAALRAQGHDVTVINAGVSGDTTTGGLARLEWTLANGADAVILELGANDMLRGIDPEISRDNLAKMLAKLKAKKIKVLLAGMRANPTMGRDYGEKFEAMYPALAKQYGVALYPVFLDGVTGNRTQQFPDRLHPNPNGVDTIVARILPSVDNLLKGLEPRS